MACPVIADFRSRFPEFNDVPDPRVQLALDDTCYFLFEAAFGDCWPRAAAYYAAHLLKSALDTTAAMTAGGDAPVQSGGITASSADGLSVSFASFTPESETTAWLNTTSYGRQFLIMVESCINTVSVDIPPYYSEWR